MLVFGKINISFLFLFQGKIQKLFTISYWIFIHSLV